MGEWFIGLGSTGQLATWLVASFLLYTLASQLAWHSQWVFHSTHFSTGTPIQHYTSDRYQERDDGLGRLIDRIHRLSLTSWLEEAMQLIYYLGIPFMAALSGWLRADLMGIHGTNWVDGKSAQGFLWDEWGQGIGLATTAVLAVLGVWFAGRVAARRASLMPVIQGIPGPLWQRLLHVLYQQIHWAFYRSGPILWLDDLYWGTFAGLALVFLESALNPTLWWSLKSSETAGPPLIRLGVAWISALLFLATQNLWLTLATHLVLAVILGKRETDNHLFIDKSV